MTREERINRSGYNYSRLVFGHAAAAEALLRSGVSLILDNALTHHAWKSDLIGKLKRFASFWVGVDCDLDVLAQREAARGDRAFGTSEREATTVHDGITYDFRIDTSRTSPQDNVNAICRAVLGGR